MSSLGTRWQAAMMDNYGTPPLGLVRGEGATVWDEDGRRYLYRPAIRREDYVAEESGRLIDRMFGGRVPALVAQLAARDKLTPADIAEIEKLLKALKS